MAELWPHSRVSFVCSRCSLFAVHEVMPAMRIDSSNVYNDLAGLDGIAGMYDSVRNDYCLDGFRADIGFGWHLKGNINEKNLKMCVVLVI